MTFQDGKCQTVLKRKYKEEQISEAEDMGNLIEFGRMFLSYGLLMLIIAVVAGVALFIGITMAKKKNAKNEALAAVEENGKS